MRATIRVRHLFVAAIFTIGILLSAGAPIYAADFTGKTVTAVSVTGNATVPESKIMAAVKVKPGEPFAPEKVQQDMRAIYELGSFFDVVANFTEVPEGVKITYTVMENPTLKEVVIKGNTKVSTDKLKSLLTVTPGNVLNSKTVNDDARAIEQYYHDQGFILARVNDVAMSPGGVLTLSINEGMLEGIIVKGNDKTKTNVITREMKIKPGEPFNAKDAKRSMQKVYNTGYFEDVNMKLNPGKEPNGVVLETDVVEQKTGTFSVGGGYSQANGLIGIIELGDNNFQGTGDKAKIHWEFGGKDHAKSYSLGYTKPWLDENQTSVGFTIFNQTYEYNDYGLNGNNRTLRSTYDRKSQGFNITVGRPQGEYIQNFVTLKRERDTDQGYETGPVNYLAPAGDPYYDANYNADWLKKNFGLTQSVALSRTYDTRDNIFNATEGKKVSLTTEFAGGAFGGDFNYQRYTFEGNQYFKVGSQQTVAVRLTAGYGAGGVPDGGKYLVGGIDTLRGYDDGEFKGNKMLTGTAEYRFPIVKKVQGVIFGDIGNAWDGGGYKLTDLKASVGVGISITTPLGPMRVNYARGDQGGMTQFGFGGQF
ncbi:MAG: BamA/TamA family outer membrane protein [Negativicutes bacterium]|nr:BamA/TamA family outer membrane protein [Negativicutes bacterium]